MVLWCPPSPVVALLFVAVAPLLPGRRYRPPERTVSMFCPLLLPGGIGRIAGDQYERHHNPSNPRAGDHYRARGTPA